MTRHRGPLFPAFLPADPELALEADGAPSGYGFDCCEESRRTSSHAVRYGHLLGECSSCGATVDATDKRNRPVMIPADWQGPVKRPAPDPGYDVDYWHGEQEQRWPL
jgi:hypothetical protein